ncbi:MAG: hypothetical protein M1818_003487 [Claussenomyces sp. TS43310]|nr:MAG: hypothetical protein M1818_003487 [Claussenomyces sp. TS43310]
MILPRLASVTAAAAAISKLTPNVVIPLYIYPSTGAWSTYTNAISANPNVTFSVVINPANGPGTGTKPDSNWIAGVAQMNAFPNVKTLGYVHTSTATRPLTDVESDISTYAVWASYKNSDIHMDGIFFDEAPSTWSATSGTYMTTVAQSARSTLASGSTVVFNPGVVADARFYNIADNIIFFENSLSAYSPARLNDVSAANRAKSTMVIHDFNGSGTDEWNIVDALKQAGYTGSFITTASDYNVIPSNWAGYSTYVSQAYGS